VGELSEKLSVMKMGRRFVCLKEGPEASLISRSVDFCLIGNFGWVGLSDGKVGRVGVSHRKVARVGMSDRKTRWKGLSDMKVGWVSLSDKKLE
jgi:hypothetical protein